MSDLGIALKEQNYDVSGSDGDLPETLHQKLTDAGLYVNSKWDVEEPSKNVDYIVPTNGVAADNVVIQKIREQNLNIMSIPEFIYDWTKNKTRLVVAGNKGKKSVLSIIMYVLQKQNIRFDYLLTQPVPFTDKAVSLALDTRIALIEGDEHFSSSINKKYNIEFYRPHIALVTNMIWKKSQEYPLKEDYLNVFLNFIKVIERDGKLIYNEKDENINQIVSNGIREDITAIPFSDHETEKNKEVVTLKTRYGAFPIKMVNAYFLQNLNSARYACRQLGVQDKEFYNAVSEYSLQF